MDKLGKLIESITKPRYEEDFMDRMNYRVTGYVLLVAAFTIIAKEYGGDPMQCWLPAELATQRGWEQYASDYCFVESTYFAPIDSRMQNPNSHRFRKDKKLTYYQWVPFMLLLQALMFTIPHVFWRMLNWTSGIHTRAVITMANNAATMNYESKEMKDLVDVVVKHLSRSLQAKSVIYRYTHSNPLVALSRIFTLSYLSTIYLITKILFIANGAFQFWLLSLYLGANGFEFTRGLLQNQSWQETGFFPRVTLCDFKVRAIGNFHRHTIQCVLMANMFNEKIFIALWWWILILISFTSINFIYWVYVVFSSPSKYTFLKGLVQLGQPKQRQTAGRLQSFMSYLGGDGVLVFRLMTQNAGDIVSGIIAASLFDTFCASKQIKHNEREYERFRNIPLPSLINPEKSGYPAFDSEKCKKYGVRHLDEKVAMQPTRISASRLQIA